MASVDEFPWSWFLENRTQVFAVAVVVAKLPNVWMYVTNKKEWSGVDIVKIFIKAC